MEERDSGVDIEGGHFDRANSKMFGVFESEVLKPLRNVIRDRYVVSNKIKRPGRLRAD
jgi:hypothetical protein